MVSGAGMLGNLVARFRREPGKAEYILAVRRIERDLARLVRSTEKDFLMVGGQLASILESVQEISRQTGSVTELVSKEQTAETLAALEEVLRFAGEARSDTAAARLHDVRTQADSVRAPLERIRTAVRNFRVLGMLTQIESARLESIGTGFSSLATDVKAVAAEIEQQTESILEASGELRNRAGKTLEAVLGAEAGQAERLQGVRTRVTAGIESLRTQHELASNMLDRLAAHYGNISGRLGEVVAALQFQDITRQQIEHVQAALKQGVRDLEGQGGLRRLGGLVDLQRAQLVGTASMFRSSVEQIRGNLQSIAREASGMAQEAENLLGLTDREGKSIFLELESSLSEVLRVLADCTAAERIRAGGMKHLEETIGQMNGIAEVIQGITIRIGRIAVNATIRATHIGSAGAALSAVAEAIEKLAADSSVFAEEVSCSVERMTSGVEDNSGHDGGARELQVEQVRHLEHGVAALHSAQEMTFGRTRMVSGLAARLAADIEQVCRRFGDQHLFLEALEDSIAGLEEMVTRAGWNAAEGGASLEDLRVQYTMHAERKVHDAAVVAAPAAADGELGDNVELF